MTTKKRTTKNKNNNDKNNNSGKNKRKAPQPGDANYKTPTQLRNARKRRKIKHDKQQPQQQPQQQQESKQHDGDSSPTKQQQQQQHQQQQKVDDPSLRYIGNPKAAPIVQKAVSFFTEKNNNNNQQLLSHFPVFVGPTSGWRTVAKLAVRNVNSILRIGLFVPGSHTLLEIPQCQAHHPSINSAVQVLQKKCRSLQIQPFDEHKGIGNLRHVAIHIERSTGHQQMTLVWKENDNNDNDNNDSSNDHGNNNNNNNNNNKRKLTPQQQLKELCDTLIRISKNKNDSRLTLHSLWIHYNNTWKHANNIFDREGKWEHVYGPTNVVETLRLEDNNNISSSTNTTSTTTMPHPLPAPPPPKVPLQFPPQVFRQANLDAFTNIVAKIRSWLIQQQQQQNELQDDTKQNNKTSKKKKSKKNNEQQQQQQHNSCLLNHCVELYGGVGTIGLHLVDLIQSSFISSDENPFNKTCFEQSVKELLQSSSSTTTTASLSSSSSLPKSKIGNGNDTATSTSTSTTTTTTTTARNSNNTISCKISYKSKNATEMVKSKKKYLQNANLIIVDPPRKGLDDEVVQALCQHSISSSSSSTTTTTTGNNKNDNDQSSSSGSNGSGTGDCCFLIYVSCGFEAFIRDFEQLTTRGNWKLDHAEGHVLFPGSDAIETLAFFTKKNK